MALMAEIMKVQEPTNLEEAMADPNWQAAMQEEYDNIMKNVQSMYLFHHLLLLDSTHFIMI